MFETIAWLSIALALLCALWIAFDEVRHPQAMGVMNVVWPVTALYFSIFALWAYYRVGRKQTKAAMSGMKMGHDHAMATEHVAHGRQRVSPTAWQVAVGTTHCGAGCVLADVLCEFAIAVYGITLLGSMLWAEYTIDFVAAWTFGIVFQYFAIKPMGNLTAGQALVAAIKADTLSIIAFQIGMYSWMALMFFKLFPHPHHLSPFQPQYWLMMQIAMICGYATSYPMNWWLIRIGLKEAM